MKEEKRINSILKSLKGKPAEKKIERISSAFVGMRYYPNPLGEGETGIFDKRPIARLDRFDCLTYVETVAALALCRTVDELTEKMIRIRYLNNKPAFENRNYYFLPKWSSSRANGKPIWDATGALDGKDRFSRIVFNANNATRLRKLKENSLHLGKVDRRKKREMTGKLRALSQKTQNRKISTTCIRFKDLFREKPGGPGDIKFGRFYIDRGLYNSIPSGSIICVLGNWEYHLGVLVRKKGKLYIRNAVSVHQPRIKETNLLSELVFYWHFTAFLAFKVFRVSDQGLR